MNITDYTLSPAVSGTARTSGGDIPYRFTFENRPVYRRRGDHRLLLPEGRCRPRRPVLFATNGGPGSSVAWLHLGLLGPKRVHMDDPVAPKTTPPFSLEDNPHCPLDLCDLVLMDPPGAASLPPPTANIKRTTSRSTGTPGPSPSLSKNGWPVMGGPIPPSTLPPKATALSAPPP